MRKDRIAFKSQLRPTQAVRPWPCVLIRPAQVMLQEKQAPNLSGMKMAASFLTHTTYPWANQMWTLRIPITCGPKLMKGLEEEHRVTRNHFKLPLRGDTCHIHMATPNPGWQITYQTYLRTSLIITPSSYLTSLSLVLLSLNKIATRIKIK